MKRKGIKMNVLELKAEMARNNMTQAKLAEKLNVTQQSVSHKLSGKRRVFLDEAAAISEALDMDASTIMKIFFDWKF